MHIVVPPNSTELVLSGSPYSIKLAKELIETRQTTNNGGHGYGSARGRRRHRQATRLAVSHGRGQHHVHGSTTASIRQATRYLAPGSRSRISTSSRSSAARCFTAELNFLIANNKARILEDPRITTISGRTASLRAGETVNILTTTGGGTGTVATTQVQSFQTGVTLDITPVVNDGDYITVTLHPSVNSIAAISAAGVPNIQTRDTTTTVGLHDGQTIVIAGLIEDLDSRLGSKDPISGGHSADRPRALYVS